MNTISKVLVGLIIVTSLGFLYLAANTLEAEGVWQKRVRDFEQAIKQEKAKNELLAHGGQRAQRKEYRLEDGLPPTEGLDPADTPGIDQYKMLLEMLAVNRGRIWQAKRTQSAPNGEAIVTITEPAEHDLKANAMVYAFEARPAEDGGQYLGEFKVMKADKQDLALAPAMRLPNEELQRLAQAQEAWILCDTMPVDRSWVLAGITPERAAKILPESVREDYLRSGKPAKEDDPEDAIVTIGDKKIYQRPLHDYATEFRTIDERLARLNDDLATATADVEQLKKTVAAVEEQIKARDMELVALNDELKKSSAEGELVKGQAEALTKRVDEMLLEARRVRDENKRRAKELWDRQPRSVKNSDTPVHQVEKNDQLTRATRPISVE
jgi:hypothetical protein